MPVVWHPLPSVLWEFNPFRVLFVTMKARNVSRQGKPRFSLRVLASYRKAPQGVRQVIKSLELVTGSHKQCVVLCRDALRRPPEGLPVLQLCVGHT